ncbi:MAG TPA: RNA polymerase sigma-70 factor [Chryseosolibacter sp.]
MKENLRFLLLQIADGDEKSFRQIFDHYASKVFVFALKLTHSKPVAEEIVQEVFIKLWNNRHRLPEVECFPSYLAAIARNHTFNVLKNIALQEKVKAEFSHQQAQTHCETEECIIHNDYQNILSQIVNELPLQQKTAYSLCYGEGLKYEEAAKRMNISTLTVKTHMQTALRTIKTRFGGTIQYCLAVAVLLT